MPGSRGDGLPALPLGTQRRKSRALHIVFVSANKLELADLARYDGYTRAEYDALLARKAAASCLQADGRVTVYVSLWHGPLPDTTFRVPMRVASLVGPEGQTDRYVLAPLAAALGPSGTTERR